MQNTPSIQRRGSIQMGRGTLSAKERKEQEEKAKAAEVLFKKQQEEERFRLEKEKGERREMERNKVVLAVSRAQLLASLKTGYRPVPDIQVCQQVGRMFFCCSLFVVVRCSCVAVADDSAGLYVGCPRVFRLIVCTASALVLLSQH